MEIVWEDARRSASGTSSASAHRSPPRAVADAAPACRTWVVALGARLADPRAMLDNRCARHVAELLG